MSIKVLNSLCHCPSKTKCLNCPIRFFAETVGVTVFQSVLTAVRQFWVPKMVGVTVYQSVLTAGRQFLVLRRRHCLSKCLNCRRQFSVPEMVGLTVYQSVLTAGR